jgi:hypothetical protein
MVIEENFKEKRKQPIKQIINALLLLLLLYTEESA